MLTQELVQIALQPDNWSKLSKVEKQSIVEWMGEQERKDKVDNFYSFCKHMDPKFFTENKPHLKIIADAFQGVADGKIKKLAVSLPPRAGKSYITSLWCAWMQGKNPKDSIMRNSYAADLAYTFSYDIREMIQKEKYLEVFPNVKLKGDRKAIDDWALTTSERSAYFCAGVGGPITGKGCNIAGILDDPIKNIEEAMSETIIEKVWKWYTSTHLSRFETGCPEIHIATRWSKKDPIGRLTDPNSEFYDPTFTTIVVSALDEKGCSFCEEVKTTKEYHSMKKITDDFIWEAEFMQNPIESKGLLFPIEELRRFSLKDLKGLPDAKAAFTDTADKGADFLCTPIGYKYDADIYIVDVVYTQDGVEITEPIVAEKCIKHNLDLMKIEANNGGESFSRNVRKILKDNGCQTYLQTEQQTQNKETRILMKAGYIKENFIFRDDYEPGSDYDKYMRALTSYVKLGKNAHDDAPDATTGLAEITEFNIYVKKQPTKIPIEQLTGYYTEDELKDKGYNKYEIKQYLNKKIKPWGNN